jgi:hypothetical protein
MDAGEGGINHRGGDPGAARLGFDALKIARKALIIPVLFWACRQYARKSGGDQNWDCGQSRRGCQQVSSTRHEPFLKTQQAASSAASMAQNQGARPLY